MTKDVGTASSERRQSILTGSDLEAISTIVEDVIQQREGHTAAGCRFIGVAPEDLREMVEAHKKFNAAMEDSKSIVRRFVVVFILTGLSGIFVVGWWEKVKRAVLGN